MPRDVQQGPFFIFFSSLVPLLSPSKGVSIVVREHTKVLNVDVDIADDDSGLETEKERKREIWRR